MQEIVVQAPVLVIFEDFMQEEAKHFYKMKRCHALLIFFQLKEHARLNEYVKTLAG